MRKNRIICFVVILSLLLSSSALALGNDFTFSKEWFSLVVFNSSFEYVNNDSKYGYYVVGEKDLTITTKFCAFDDTGIVGNLDNPFPFVYYDSLFSYIPNTPNVDKTLVFTSPLDVSVQRGQTLNLQSMLFSNSYNNLNISVQRVRFNLSDGSTILNVPFSSDFGSCSLGSVSLNSNGIFTGFQSEIDGAGNLVNITWTNNLDKDVKVRSVRVEFLINKNLSGFYYGFFANSFKESVTLPSYVEENLSTISSELMTVNDNFEEALNELEAIKSELASLAEKLNQSGSTTNNYYQTITQATEEQVVKQEQLDELVATARSELEEMKETLNTVTVPTSSDVSSATTSQATQISIDDSLSNATINGVLGKLFENTTLVTMMLSCISIATVGYILYGKRG